MIKNKLLTKDQISEKYKKMRIAAIVGYCLNALLLLLIVLSMVFGSNNANSVSAQNENHNQLVRKNLIDNDYTLYSYDCVYNATDYTFDETFQSQLSEKCNNIVDVSTSYASVQDVSTYVFNFTGDAYLRNLDDNSLSPVSSFVVSFATFPHPNNILYRYRLNYISFGSDNGNYVLCYKTDTTSYDNYNYHFYATTYRLVTSQNEINDLAFKQFYTLYGESSSFTFNSSFNFNAPLGGTINNKFMSVSGVTDTIYTITYDTGVFVSNGKLYDSIKLVYWHASLYLFSTEDGSYELGPSNQYTFKSMYYHPYGTSDSATQLVCSRDTGDVYISGTWTPYQLQSVTWHNDEYRHLVFLQTLSDGLIININAFNNNTDLSINNYNSGSFLNVFTLVASAITGLMPILNMVILPGVTIGILLFIPLVAMLVFAIIRIIKK